jgi:hypothetical protein
VINWTQEDFRPILDSQQHELLTFASNGRNLFIVFSKKNQEDENRTELNYAMVDLRREEQKKGPKSYASKLVLMQSTLFKASSQIKISSSKIRKI